MERCIEIADASLQTQFNRPLTTATFHVTFIDKKEEKEKEKDKGKDKENEIQFVKMSVEWDGFKHFGSPPFQGTFYVGQEVFIFTGKCLDYGKQEDVGGFIEDIVLSKDDVITATVNGRKRFLIDCHEKPM